MHADPSEPRLLSCAQGRRLVRRGGSPEPEVDSALDELLQHRERDLDAGAKRTNLACGRMEVPHGQAAPTDQSRVPSESSNQDSPAELAVRPALRGLIDPWQRVPELESSRSTSPAQPAGDI